MVHACQVVIVRHNFSNKNTELANRKTLQMHAHRLQTTAQVVDIM